MLTAEIWLEEVFIVKLLFKISNSNDAQETLYQGKKKGTPEPKQNMDGAFVKEVLNKIPFCFRNTISF